MKIEKLKLKNYRNYEKLELKLNDNLNIIIGDNAQGKTNILESIYVLAITKSFLSVSEKKLIMFDKDFFKITGQIKKMDTKKELEVISTLTNKKVKIDNQEIKKIGDYISNLNVIIFNPDNIRMIKEGPNIRRKYLNIQISQLNNKYLNILNEYNLLLKQKNEFLKIINIKLENHLNYLEILNQKLVEKAIDIYIYRSDYIKRINSNINSIFKELLGYGNLEIKYIPQIENLNEKEEIKNELLEKIKNNQSREIQYKMGLIGPHRDDFNFFLNDKNISLYGSQGQLRISLLALKLTEVKIFMEQTRESPILLLDDIFSELDINKRNNLINFLDNEVQTIITTTDIKSINKKLLKNATIFIIDNGKLIDRKDDKNE